MNNIFIYVLNQRIIMEIKELYTVAAVRNEQGVYEKEAEIGLSLLAALAGESILCWDLLGWQSRWWPVG